MKLYRILRLPTGRVLHLVDSGGWSVCGRYSREWTQWTPYYRHCRLCAKGDRLRMPT